MSRASKKAPLGLFCPPDCTGRADAVRIRPLSPEKVSTKQKIQHPVRMLDLLVGAGGFEPPKLKSSRFTVCPHWPLGNTPRFNFYSHSRLPVYLTISPRFCQPIFEKDFYKSTTFSQNAAFAWFLFSSRSPIPLIVCRFSPCVRFTIMTSSNLSHFPGISQRIQKQKSHDIRRYFNGISQDFSWS